MTKNKEAKQNWGFGKNGNVINVSTPITADGKPAPYTGTVAGGLHASVGFTGFHKTK